MRNLIAAVFAGLLLLTGLCATAAPVAAEFSQADAEHELRVLFGEAITISMSAGQARVAYCPDNTCEVFQGLGAQAVDVLEFALGYLLYVSDYEALKPVRGSSTAEASRQHILAHSDMIGCEGTTGARVACWLAHCGRSASLVMFFVRYDEGARNEVRINWRAQLQRLE